MSDSFLGQVLGSALAWLLAVTAAVGLPQPTAHQTQPDQKRNPLADKVEVPLGRGTQGRDIGWPNCPPGMGIPERRTLGKPLPPVGTRFVLVGLTNGPGFYPNPCLRDQVAYARRLHLWASAYAVVTYPTTSQLARYGGAGPSTKGGLAGRLWNTGWAQAQQNVATMRAAGMQLPTLWVDVEPVRPPAPWPRDVLANRTVLEGSRARSRHTTRPACRSVSTPRPTCGSPWSATSTTASPSGGRPARRRRRPPSRRVPVTTSRVVTR